ncbi:hypothetical protein GCM10022243_40140 [Saccharothrix violaceirubra]|uniref:Uncharacterized protein n=1 Tax=Saccharothrix violaceirubra TaxID=413306 RepID=A0A7W7WYB8_9PSEU|nr:hypothetical protein [Saccharothrix violaceirubra]MBB4968270.1 hypothetical protein [Saccharothrix violaceirubra]
MTGVWLAIAAVCAVAGLSLVRVTRPAAGAFAEIGAASPSVELRPDPNAGFSVERGFAFRDRVFFLGTGCPPLVVSGYADLDERRKTEPVLVARQGRRAWWWFEDGFHTEAVGHRAADIAALVREQEDRERRREDRIDLLHAVDENLRRRDGKPGPDPLDSGR